MEIEESELQKSVAATMRDAVKLKKVMMKRGLRTARAKCPECEGELHGVLAGKRNHLHMSCNCHRDQATLEPVLYYRC